MLKLNGIVSALPHHSGRSVPQPPFASAASEFSNPALGTVTQERAGGRDIETKVGWRGEGGGTGGRLLVKVLLG